MKKIDARGLSCPQPVLLTKKAIDAGEKDIEAVLDDATAKDNVKRLAEDLGFGVQTEVNGNDFVLKIAKNAK